jgi:hypothetical protein
MPVLQTLLSQQGCPEPPQAAQVAGKVAWQTKPVEHALLAQQGWLAPPQAWHVPLVPIPVVTQA